MGARAQVKIQEYNDSPSVYLYTHWGAETVKEDVRKALSKNGDGMITNIWQELYLMN